MARAARSGTRFDIAILVLCVVLSLLTLALPQPMRAPVAGALRRTVMAPLVTVQRGTEQWRVAWRESERLALGHDSLVLAAANANALRLENDRLRSLLGLGSRLQWGFVPAEALQATARPGDVITSLVLSAGSNAGIAMYSPVVGPDGVIGLVQSADPTTSIAMLFSNPDFRVSAMTADGGVFGIVYPHAGSGGDGYLLELRNVVFSTLLKPGTQIITSGLGGVFPRGIPVGRVVAEINTTEGWSRTYLLRPAVNPANVTSVMVMTPYRATQGVGNVWALPASAESAQRRVLGAADSLAKRAAALDAARRLARADSIKADSIKADSARADSVRRARAPGGGPS
ncbi:MAG TPA: rod shape-determining protein MreC [Gemmatimonadaceae bacterium]|nr:rod shape-determining protein MreC [Gemmatimonadaceae bacterium]